MDGGSRDQTRAIIESYHARFPYIQLLDNPDKYVPQAMNRGIAAAKGDIIIRLDAHARYPKDYFEKLVHWSIKTGADNVGGVWNTVPRSTKITAHALAILLAHPIAVGNASFRLGVSKPTEADTVPFGCFKKETFQKYGNYDDRLHRNQDIELNKRIRSHGGRVLLVPDISCDYYARDTFSSLIKNNYDNGKWVILTAYFTKNLGSLSLRHFIPLGFVIYWLILGLLIVFNQLTIWTYPLIVLGIIYLFAILSASLIEWIKRKEFALVPRLFFGFLCLHFSYGLGSLRGMWEVLFNKKDY